MSTQLGLFDAPRRQQPAGALAVGDEVWCPVSSPEDGGRAPALVVEIAQGRVTLDWGRDTTEHDLSRVERVGGYWRPRRRAA